MPPPNPGKAARRKAKRARAADAAGIGTFRHHTRVQGLFVAVIWNAFSWILTPVAWLEFAQFPWRAAVLAAPIIGVPLGFAAARNYVRYRRDGEARLFLDPKAPQIGAPFRARFVSAKPPADGRVFVARILCRRIEYGADDAPSKEIWSTKQEMTVRDGVAATEILLPADMPHAHPASSDVSYGWVIELDRGGYRQDYDLPVGPLEGSAWDAAAKAHSAGRSSLKPAYARARDRTPR